MKKWIFNLLKIGFPVGLGIWAIQFELNQLSATEKTQLWDAIQTANPFFLILSGIVGLISHLSRSIRWKYTLEPIGYQPKLTNSFNAIMLSYFVNIFIPRGGELTRSAVIFRTEGIPVTKSFGTIVTERIADLFCLILIVLLVIGLESEKITNLIEEKFGSKKPGLSLLFIFLGAIALGLLANYMINRLKEQKLFSKLHEIKEGLIHGVFSIFKMKNWIAYMGHTFFIWICYALMHYFCFLSVPALAHAGIGAVLTSFVMGGITMIIFSGGLGIYPLAIKDTLVVFGFGAIPSYALGWVIWITQTLMLIIGGMYSGISFLISKKNNAES